MKFNYDRSFKFKVNEDTWVGYLITEEEGIELDEQIHGDEADINSFTGMVVFEEKALFLAEGNVEKTTIAHELFHVTVHYMHLSSAALTVDQFEEVIAVWSEDGVDKFIKMRNKLYRKFKQLEGSGQEK